MSSFFSFGSLSSETFFSCLLDFNSSQETKWAEFIWYCTRWFRSCIKVNFCSLFAVNLQASLFSVEFKSLHYHSMLSGIYVSKVWWSGIYLGMFLDPLANALQFHMLTWNYAIMPWGLFLVCFVWICIVLESASRHMARSRKKHTFFLFVYSLVEISVKFLCSNGVSYLLGYFQILTYQFSCHSTFFFQWSWCHPVW